MCQNFSFTGSLMQPWQVWAHQLTVITSLKVFSQGKRKYGVTFSKGELCCKFHTWIRWIHVGGKIWIWNNMCAYNTCIVDISLWHFHKLSLASLLADENWWNMIQQPGGKSSPNKGETVVLFLLNLTSCLYSSHHIHEIEITAWKSSNINFPLKIITNWKCTQMW